MHKLTVCDCVCVVFRRRRLCLFVVPSSLVTNPNVIDRQTDAVGQCRLHRVRRGWFAWALVARKQAAQSAAEGRRARAKKRQPSAVWLLFVPVTCGSSPIVLLSVAEEEDSRTVLIHDWLIGLNVAC